MSHSTKKSAPSSSIANSDAKTLQRLNEALQHGLTAPFYQKRLPPKPLTSLSQWKSIPLLYKEDLVAQSPFGMLCQPREELRQYHESFGTTGMTVSTWLSEKDVQDNYEEVATCAVNFQPQDTVLVRFPYAISLIAHMVHRAAQSRGASVIPASSRSTISPFPRIIELMRKLEVTVLAALPLQVLLLAETAKLLGLSPKQDFPHLRAILTGGEPLPPGKRKHLEEIWAVPIYEVYGMTEIGTAVTSCEQKQAHSLEDYFYFEVLDDNLQTDVESGQIGNLVITSLTAKATPIIRYVTNDRVCRLPEPCTCGRGYPLQIRGRRQDLLWIEQKAIDVWDIDSYLTNLTEAYPSFWVAGLDEKGLRLIIEQEGLKTVATQKEVMSNSSAPAITIETVPVGTLYDRRQLLDTGKVGKPRYIYSRKEMAEQAYLHSDKI
ncbi:phenylacetate--CoA ligase family protein [Heliorestis acidaminivorans]|uniref:phenylacetate--CoA ligase family protein n=1 Tax=Heliorestis acidaminivorans TaxID=553427 RepID=UPI0014796F4B|nr:AMP-binding protein [Heliorestis acidaminivorans]